MIYFPVLADTRNVGGKHAQGNDRAACWLYTRGRYRGRSCSDLSNSRYAFESAEHCAALFNLETEGYRYSRISQSHHIRTRAKGGGGGVASLCVSTGEAALHYALVNLVEIGSNIVSVPQLYGTTHTLFTHLLRDMGVTVRFAETDQAAAIDRLIDNNTGQSSAKASATGRQHL